MNLRIFLEQETGRGEDRGISGERYAFVFDGLGGSGGKKRTNSLGETMTEAKIASTAAAVRMEAFVENNWDDWVGKLDFSSEKALLESIQTQIVDSMQIEMLEALQTAAEEYNANDKESKFPTTIAGWLCFPTPNQRTLAISLWAGDSRCYLLDAKGMKQCSKDSTNNYLDPLDELRSDCVLNNLLRVNDSFTIEYSCHMIECPTLLMCCSDGFYRGISSPMHLEYYLRKVFGQGESIENMQELWNDFFLEPVVEDQPETNLLHDDCATMESVFVGATSDDFQALKEMLLAPLPLLEEEYINAIPDVADEAEVDIEQKIVAITSQLKRDEEKYHFYENLKNNIIWYLTKEADYPAALPCASLIRSLKPLYEAMKQRKHDEWQNQKDKLTQKAKMSENEMDNLLSTMKKSVVLHYTDDPTPGQLVKDTFSSKRIDHMMQINLCFQILESIRSVLPNLWGNMNPSLEYGGLVGQRGEGPDSLIKYLDQFYVDLIYATNQISSFLHITPGLERATARTHRVVKQEIQLNRWEAERLRQYALDKAENHPTYIQRWDSILDPMTDGGVHQSLQLSDIIRLLDLAANFVADKRKADSFEETPTSVDEEFERRLDEEFSKYLLRMPRADAKYLLTEWYTSQQKPAYFQMDRSLESSLSKGIEKLKEIAHKNEEIRNQNAKSQETITELWERYRVCYEAWDEPFTCVATENKAETADDSATEASKNELENTKR